jgi:hypothetical protein
MEPYNKIVGVHQCPLDLYGCNRLPGPFVRHPNVWPPRHHPVFDERQHRSRPDQSSGVRKPQRPSVPPTLDLLGGVGGTNGLSLSHSCGDHREILGRLLPLHGSQPLYQGPCPKGRPLCNPLLSGIQRNSVFRVQINSRVNTS